MPMADPSAAPPAPPGESNDPPDPLVYPSRPPTSGELALRDKFFEHLAGQIASMNDLARQMVAVELAVPGLFATALALLRGPEATLPAVAPLFVAFGGWFVALALTFAALFPRRYRVDAAVLRAGPAARPAGQPPTFGLEDFFHQTALAKYRLLLAAALAFGVGVVAAVVLLFVSPAAP